MTVLRADVAPPASPVVATGVLVALWCAGFALFNIWFESTSHFATGPYAEDAAGLSVMNWFVTLLKAAGAALAVLAVRARPAAPRAVALALWAAFSTVAVYAAGSTVLAVGLLTGLTGSADELDLRASAYLLAFFAASVGFGVLAASFSQRTGQGRRVALAGACGGPVLIATVLVLAPAVLTASGLLTEH